LQNVMQDIPRDNPEEKAAGLLLSLRRISDEMLYTYTSYTSPLHATCGDWLGPIFTYISSCMPRAYLDQIPICLSVRALPAMMERSTDIHI